MGDLETAKALFLEGLSLLENSRNFEAEEKFRQSLKFAPQRVSTLTNLATALIGQNKFEEAKLVVNQILDIDSNSTDAWQNLGIISAEQSDFSGALECFDRVIALSPENFEAFNNRGNAFKAQFEYQAATESYRQALDLNPDIEYLPGMLFHLRMKICDWRDFDADRNRLIEGVDQGRKVVSPFAALAMTADQRILFKTTSIFSANYFPQQAGLGAIGRRSTNSKKIRIGYFSADFFNHATSYLMAELFELHDRKKFDLIGFSFGADVQDEMRSRIESTFDRFIDVRNKGDKEVAELARSLEVDIAVDLKGFTEHSRSAIFAWRAAPIQVNYLGYPGTMCADYIDYIIADRQLIPETSLNFYSEKIIYLPNSYQVNDSKRRIASRAFVRGELGLPSTGFVFCCFNNNYKITPEIFNGWMRILDQVVGSVLWLFEDNPVAAINLRNEASLRGIDPQRLVFAKHLSLPEHLARHRLADLFLDTYPCSAHTTASDSLWAGLPLITLIGESFASRVAASLLNAMDLPELVTSSQVAYEKLAVLLALSPNYLSQIKIKLQRNLKTTPLFDTPLFTKHLELSYEAMHKRHCDGFKPDHIHISD